MIVWFEGELVFWLKSGSLSRNSTGSTKSSAASAAAAVRLSSPQQSFRRLGLLVNILLLSSKQTEGREEE